MRAYRIAPRVRGAESAFRAHLATSYPGLKRWAILSDHFMVKIIIVRKRLPRQIPSHTNPGTEYPPNGS